MKRLARNLHWSVIRNSAALVGGRLSITLCRLLVTILIVRLGSAELLGQYALVLSFIFIAEWLVDFGMTEICVRDICQDPSRRRRILRTLTQLKAAQIAGAYLLMLLAVWALGYDALLLKAAALGGAGLVFYAGAIVYRTLFRVEMRMDKDVGAELAGVVIMVPLIAWAASQGASVVALVACYVLSRVVFFVLALAWGNHGFKLASVGSSRRDAAGMFMQALPVGVLGLLVTIYDSVAPIALSKFMGMTDVALYTAAMRILFPMVIVTQSIAATFYPLLSSYWTEPGERFRSTQQDAVNATVLIAGVLLCFLYGSAEFLMGLVGQQMAQSAGYLKILSWALLARTVTTVMAPPVIIAGGQWYALGLTLFSVTAHVTFVLWLVPAYGIMGVVASFVLIEFVFSMVPTILISQRLAAIRLRWSPAVKVALSCVAAVALVNTLEVAGTFSGGIIAMAAYFLLVIVTGACSVGTLRSIVATVRNRNLADPGSS